MHGGFRGVRCVVGSNTSDPHWKKIHRMAIVDMMWMKPDGSEPMMGDSDDIDMRDICTVLFVRFGLGGTTMQFPVRFDVRRNQALVGQDVPKDLQGITHALPPACQDFR